MEEQPEQEKNVEGDIFLYQRSRPSHQYHTKANHSRHGTGLMKQGLPIRDPAWLLYNFNVPALEEDLKA